MNKARGLIAPPARYGGMRDPRRLFTPFVIGRLLERQGNRCANPKCRNPVTTLQAHHLYAHCLGGPTVENNGIVLCRACHAMVHRGLVPLLLLVAWRTHAAMPIGYASDDETMATVRAAPVTLGLRTGARMATLNNCLVAAHQAISETAKHAILGQAMLAKAAVLADVEDSVSAPLHARLGARSHRLGNALPFTSAAIAAGRSISDHSVVVRALHYRAIAAEACGSPAQALRVLIRARDSCRYVDGTLRPHGYHELSTPSRILRACGLARARCNGSPTLARMEYEEGFRLAERLGSEFDYNEARVRVVQLYDAIGDTCSRDDALTDLIQTTNQFDPDTALLIGRLWVEHLIRYRKLDEAQRVLEEQLALAAERGHHAHQLRLLGLATKLDEAHA